jgi:hypothetical protein
LPTLTENAEKSNNPGKKYESDKFPPHFAEIVDSRRLIDLERSSFPEFKFRIRNRFGAIFRLDEKAGAVFVNAYFGCAAIRIPIVAACSPRKRRAEAVEKVEKRPS